MWRWVNPEKQQRYYSLQWDTHVLGYVLAIVDELLQRGDMRQITTREEIDPDAGVNQNH